MRPMDRAHKEGIASHYALMRSLERLTLIEWQALSHQEGQIMSTLALKFLDFALRKEQIESKYKINAGQCKVLSVATRAHLVGSPLKVRDLLNMQSIASPATIHKVMKSLIDLKLLRAVPDRDDARIRHLAPTPAALRLYQEIGSQM